MFEIAALAVIKESGPLNGYYPTLATIPERITFLSPSAFGASLFDIRIELLYSAEPNGNVWRTPFGLVYSQEVRNVYPQE